MPLHEAKKTHDKPMKKFILSRDLAARRVIASPFSFLAGPNGLQGRGILQASQ